MNEIELAKKLLAWNKCYLTAQSNLTQDKIAECFDEKFIVRANGKEYSADYNNYFEFLNHFRATINSIDYHVYEYIYDNNSVVLPMKATVKRIDKTVDIFDAMLWLKFNSKGLITLWHEVYLQIK